MMEVATIIAAKATSRVNSSSQSSILLRVSCCLLRVFFNCYIFVIPKFGIIGPIVRAGNYKLIINDTELVMHQTSTLTFLNLFMRQKRNVYPMFFIYAV